MIFFILGNLVSLCMKIINSVVVVGLYYGFLTTFSMGPSYLFLLRARVIEEGEEGTEKKVSATTGFITGQLMMFLSIYYAPLHLALGRPHTITVLALPYLLLNFFWNNHKHFFDYGSTTGNSMRKLSIQFLFLNNFIFQLFNHFFLPSSTLIRLINISMFQSKNKMLFVTTSFIGWLIGHILLMKWIGLILVWIQTNNSIRLNKYIGSNTYLVSELRNSMARIFSILLFITCIYSLGRVSSPIFSKKLKKTPEVEQRREEGDIEIEPKYKMRETKQEEEEEGDSSLFSEEREDPYETAEMDEIQMNGKKKAKDEFHYQFVEGNQEKSKLEILVDKKEQNLFWFEEPPVTILFDSNRWNRPFRYIKNNQLENAVRKEMSQYFFYPCQSDGKERISFTYLPSLSTFWEMIEKKMSLFKTEKLASDELYNHWNYKNEQKKKNISNEFRNRVEALDKGSPYLNKLETKTRFCNHETKKAYLPKIYDPLLSGPYRGRIKKGIFRKNYREMFWINKIHLIFIINYHEFEATTDVSNGKPFSTEIGYFLNLINEFGEKPISSFCFERFFLFPEPKEEKINFENGRKVLQFLFDRILLDPTKKASSKKYTRIKEISKQVPRWSYKLIDTLEQQEGDSEERVRVDHELRSRKSKRVIIFTDNPQNTDIYNKSKETTDADQMGEVALIRYSQQSDFRRDIIKGSIRAQRRKTPVWELFQTNVHSPIFLDRIDKSFFFFFSFDIPELMKIIFTTWMCKNSELTLSNYTEEKEKKKQENKRDEDKRDEKTQIEIAEAWDSILLAQIVRSCVLVIHSFLRKFILLPSLIIAKNIIRMLLFQFPEWSEDFKDWKKEMHVKCTYNGVPLSEREFPKNWLTEGIQIKILFPFRLKPWHRSKTKFVHKNPIQKKVQKTYFCFLTVWGLEAELPFGSPQKHLSLFEVFFKELEKKIRKWKKNSFRVLRIFKEQRIFFFTFSEERKNWFVKNLLFLQEILNKLSKSKKNPTQKIPGGEVYELKLTETQKEKGSINTNWTIKKLSPKIQSRDGTNSSLTEKKMKDLTAKTNTTINQIKKIRKEKKKKLKISKKSYTAKSLNLKSLKRLLKIRNARVVRKSRFFIKLWVEKIYRHIFLGIINIPRVNAHLFLQSASQIFAKSIFNNEKNDKRIVKTNPNTIHFISIIKKFVNISTLGLISNNSDLFCDVVPLSQAYVFYKLSKTQGINLYKLRSVLQYEGTSQFLKNEIKEFFETQGLLHSKLKKKNLKNYLMNEWKTCLINHYQYKYNLSKIKWSKLIPQKLGNRIHQCPTVQNKDLDKCNFSEKNQLSQYEKHKKLGSGPLTNEKDNLKKHFRYNLLSYKSLNYEENSNTEKGHFFDMFSISNYLSEDNILDIEKRPNRKYFDWTILHFCLNKKGDMESWVELGTKQKEHTKTRTNKYKKMDMKDSFFLTIPQDQEVTPANEKQRIFDWMGMNDEMINFCISNFELWFFQKFVILSNAYKRKPWVIPINLLLLNLEVNANVNEKKRINGNKNENLIISRNKKKWIELEKLNYEEKEPQDQVDFGSVLANEEKVLKENFGESTMKSRKKKQDKSNREAELDFFLKRYLRFQLRWDDSLNQKIITNIKIYCLLLRLTNPREVLLSYVQRKEINLDILMIQRGLTLTELMKKGILIIEPERLPVKNNGKFFMYHMINILLVHKNKQKINQRYKEINYVNKQKFAESIERDQSIIGNIEKNDYDLLVPENILSPKRRRELRIRICFNSKSKKKNAIPKYMEILNDKNLKHGCHVFKPFDRKKKEGRNLKFFLWPNYRLEDLACMNRYWFDANNGSRFSMVRIRIYPRLKSR